MKSLFIILISYIVLLQPAFAEIKTLDCYPNKKAAKLKYTLIMDDKAKTVRKKFLVLNEEYPGEFTAKTVKFTADPGSGGETQWVINLADKTAKVSMASANSVSVYACEDK